MWIFNGKTGVLGVHQAGGRHQRESWPQPKSRSITRRRAQKAGIRPLKLHAPRHTWATFTLWAGKSVRWVADQLGHKDPALTLRVYAHAMREEETDLSFAEFGDPGRPYTAPAETNERDEFANPTDLLVGRQGLEPWTLGLKARCSAN